jgi:hypothetical protein
MQTTLPAAVAPFADSLSASGYGERMFEKFFVTNGEWLVLA